MGREAWTDERLDDMSRRMDVGFDRVDREVRDVRGEVAGLRTEMHQGFAEVRGELNGLRLLMLRMFGGLVASLIAANLTVLATTLLH